MLRLLCSAVVFVGLAHAPLAHALDQETPVEFKMSSIDQRQIMKRLDEGDTLTGKALLKLRYYRESQWLFEEELDISAGDKVEVAKVEKAVKLDRTKQIECHVLLPTTKGKWLTVVAVKKTASVLGSKPTAYKLGCSTMGAGLAKQDSIDFKWPDVGSPTEVNFGYAINIDAAVGAAVAKSKDDVTRSQGKIPVLVELFDMATKQPVGRRSLALDPKTPRGLGTYALITNGDSGSEEVKVSEGTPLLYRLTIGTHRDAAVLAEGETTPWRLASNQPRSTITIEATFRYEKDPKKAPKLGVWTSTKAPAKAPAKAKAPPKKK